MSDLRTIFLTTGCDHRVFTRALDPEQNPWNLVLCPNMEELVIYTPGARLVGDEELARMATNRASRGVKLPLIRRVTVRNFGVLEVPGLREHATKVVYSTSREPAWDSIPGE